MKPTTILVYLCLLFLVTPVSLAAIIHVPADQPTIQAAIDVAINGDTVLVDPGTYLENIDFKGKGITVQSANGAAVTVIDGRQLDSVVRFTTKETPDAVLDGFTVTNGHNPNRGGGIYCDEASPVIKNNTITGNSTPLVGGGIGIDDFCYPMIENNVLSHNTAQEGGAISSTWHAFPTVVRNIICNNTAVLYGGALHTGDANATLEENLIYENTAGAGGALYGGPYSVLLVRNNQLYNNSATSTTEGKGGGIYCYIETKLIACNNMVIGNSASLHGGGMFLYKCGVTTANNTFANNVASDSGGGMAFHYCFGTIANTILWNNTAPQGKELALLSTPGGNIIEVSYSNVEGGQASTYVEPPNNILIWGPGMIDADPLFIEPCAEDRHLLFLSPCKDAGDNTAVIGVEDFEGDPRVANGTVDIGADEFDTHLYYTGDATPGGNVSLKFIGLPNTVPVDLFIGSGIQDPPLPSMWGDWFLQFPVMGPITLAPIPVNGVEVLSGGLPGIPPAPYSIPMQALIGAELTNLCIMNVE